MYIGLHVKCWSLLSDGNESWFFIDGFAKNPQISNFIKIRPVGAELFQADGQTDVTILILPFQNFVNATKNTEWSLKKNRWRSTSTIVWVTARWVAASRDTARWVTAMWDIARWDTARWVTARWVTVVVLGLQVKLERTHRQKQKTNPT
jgi:hypothetical protein